MNDQIAYTPSEAAKKSGMSRTQVYELMKAGELRYVQLNPKRRLITHEELERFIRSLGTANVAAA